MSMSLNGKKKSHNPKGEWAKDLSFTRKETKMVNKPMKRDVTSLVIREMQIKALSP